jgi:hypothetical protein
VNSFSQQRHVQRAADSKAIGLFWAKAEKHRKAQIEAASIVLQDIAKFGGETAGVVISARIVLRNEAERRAAQ